MLVWQLKAQVFDMETVIMEDKESLQHISIMAGQKTLISIHYMTIIEDMVVKLDAQVKSHMQHTQFLLQIPLIERIVLAL